MDQCKIIDICKWKYCNIGHIDGMKFISTKFWSATTFPHFSDNFITFYNQCDQLDNTLIYLNQYVWHDILGME
jgi:hypothetical protein